MAKCTRSVWPAKGNRWCCTFSLTNKQLTKQVDFTRIVRNGSRKAKMWLWWPRKELYNQFQPLKVNDPIKTIPLLPDGPPGHSISSRCHPPAGQNKEQTLSTSNIHTKEQDYGFCTKLFLFKKFNDQTNLRTGPTSSEKSKNPRTPDYSTTILTRRIIP